ncbi:tetratricopeptide repeat protein [Roseiconus nitratireducens]|uniref:Tetratricopeptide repeat protein n=1 Tax=Roseiconus nitratireducens TaxID=2605748 RepID=A0A5M6D253_9BACT|nr:tetratricopeptide repeat protein [Roseiconus nitratireducens]KAA5541086.1 tetratricopeptide repeat protein [Roseiconus nitratireducens]
MFDEPTTLAAGCRRVVPDRSGSGNPVSQPSPQESIGHVRALGHVRAVGPTGRVAAAPRSVVRRRRFLRAGMCLGLSLGGLLGGCSPFRGSNESIVRVKSSQNPARAGKLTTAGIRSLGLGHIDQAAEQFREAVAEDFTYGPAHNNLGLMHYEQGNLYQAVLAFEQAREFLPGDPAVLYNLALALEATGRIDEALTLYGTAHRMDRSNPNYLGNLVRLRVRRGDRDELLRQQLEELVLIETRPPWRRWADRQLALNLNDALDRGPVTPELESAMTTERRATDLREKVIDLTPVATASLEEDGLDRPFDREPGRSSLDPQIELDRLPDGPPEELPPPAEVLDLQAPTSSSRSALQKSVLQETDVEALSVDDYYRQ